MGRGVKTKVDSIRKGGREGLKNPEAERTSFLLSIPNPERFPIGKNNDTIFPIWVYPIGRFTGLFVSGITVRFEIARKTKHYFFMFQLFNYNLSIIIY